MCARILFVLVFWDEFMGFNLTYLAKFPKMVLNPKFGVKTVLFQKYLNQTLCEKGKKKGFNFVYIGANDGVTGSIMYDLIEEFGWQGVAVEPQKKEFKKLVKNYSKFDGVKFENSAIGPKTGKIVFHENGLGFTSSIRTSKWLDGRRNIIRRLFDQVIPEKSVEVEIDSMTLSDFVKKYKIKKLDFFHCDTEGFDYEIVKQIDFGKLRPEMILIEVVHMNKKELAECKKKFEKNGYEVSADGWDMLAVR